MRRTAASPRAVWRTGLCACAFLAAAPWARAADDLVSRPVGFVRIGVASNANVIAGMPFYAFDPDIQSVFKNWLTGATRFSSGTKRRRRT